MEFSFGKNTEHMKDFANETYKVLPAGGVYRRAREAPQGVA